MNKNNQLWNVKKNCHNLSRALFLARVPKFITNLFDIPVLDLGVTWDPTSTVLAPVSAQFHSPLSEGSSVYLFPERDWQIQFHIVRLIHCFRRIFAPMLAHFCSHTRSPTLSGWTDCRWSAISIAWWAEIGACILNMMRVSPVWV